MGDESLFIGVDVGTGSARGALVTDKGKVLKVAVTPIKTWNQHNKYYEQSSQNIWNACIQIIKEITIDIQPSQIKGIGFDATCSLVAISKSHQPISLSTSGSNDQNIILWLDHRAEEEADFINGTQHPLLKFVGGKVSLEMEMPKILWIKKNLPHIWDDIEFFFDLPDFLTWKATGSNSRSLCSVVCKWNYEANSNGTCSWNKSFLQAIGLDDLLTNNCSRIGGDILPPGDPCGAGLSKESADELGLLPGTPVGTSIIDAHAGGLGMIGCSAESISPNFDTRLSLICGTSTCHMAISSSPTFVPGVWGPYWSAMVPGYWLNEAGQSASGILIEHIINSHPATVGIKKKLSETMFVQDYLNDLIKSMTNEHFICRFVQDYLNDLIKSMTNEHNVKDCCYLTKDFHVWPDFHGNRSPVADSSLLGMVSGLKLSSDENSLAVLYLAALQALAYGTRHIMETMRQSGHKDFRSILICGGLANNALFVQIQADVVSLPLLRPREPGSVTLGAAILGACAAKYYSDIQEAAMEMGGEAVVVYPNKEVYYYHEKKYKVFLKMLSDQLSYRELME